MNISCCPFSGNVLQCSPENATCSPNGTLGFTKCGLLQVPIFRVVSYSLLLYKTKGK